MLNHVVPEGADHNEIFRFELATEDAPTNSPASLDRIQLESSPDDYTVTLSSKPDVLKANESAELTLNIRRNGKPVKDLKPYLGALGHMVIISEDTKGYLHTHPQGDESMPSMKGMSKSSTAGSDVSFHTLFSVAGKYKVWAQFNHNGKIHTADFVIDVKE